jgi:prepilin-type N-terminal cleavage/methylation domain-containing protein
MKAYCKSGFTLIEVILALVVTALALVAVLPFLDRVFLLGHEPREQLRAALSLQSAMDGLVLEHRLHTNDLEHLRMHVGSEGATYASEFVVINNHYVDFPGNLEAVDASHTNLLKITLQNTLGEQVTRLFTVPL